MRISDWSSDVCSSDLPGAADRAHERNARDGERGRRADHGDDVRIVLEVMRQHGGDDLGLVAEAVGEQRADRAVDQTRGQRLLLARPAFTLEEAAGDLAGRERLFLVVHGQREKIDAGLRRSEERRVGKEGVSTRSSRWSLYA